MRTLAEGLALIALPPSGQVPTAELDRAVHAATIVDLLLLGRVRVLDDQVEVVATELTGDDLVDGLFGRMVDRGRPRAVKRWIGGEPSRPHEQVLDRLAAGGHLVVTRRRATFRGPRYELGDPQGPRRARTGLREALLGRRALDARDAALAALVVAGGMAGRLLVTDERAEARERIRQALRPPERLAGVEAVCAAVRPDRDDDSGWAYHVGDDGSPDAGHGGADGAGGDGGGGGGGD